MVENIHIKIFFENEKRLERIINEIGYENILKIRQCYYGIKGECAYTIIYKESIEE